MANWRRRYPEFPQPVAGGPNSPLFSWAAVQQWLVDTGKAEQLAAEGRTSTGTQQLGDASPPGNPDRGPTALTPPELLARVVVSLLPRLGDTDRPGDEVDPPVVLDPACRDAIVLTAVAERFGDHVRLAGQAPDEVHAEAVRRSLSGLDADVRVGDALQADRFAASRATARAVVCIPPPSVRQWPAPDLAADPRWRYGLPDPADPELAWVQHCLGHLRPRGMAVVMVPAVTGVRPSGRHVRDALVRAGVLRAVIALPEGLTPSGAGAVHLWVLQRGGVARGVRMVDLTGVGAAADVPQVHAAWHALWAGDHAPVARVVPQAELLDGEVPLVPSRYLRARFGESVADLGQFTHRVARLHAKLGQALPRPVAPGVPPRFPEVTLGELERSKALTILPRDATPRAGDLLFRTMGREPVVARGTPEDERGIAQVIGIDTDRLDPHFVARFVRTDALAAPVANTHGALTRDDVRRCRIPRLTLAEQRRYGDAFRLLEQLEMVADRLAGVTRAILDQTIYGLTTGALMPAAVGPGETIDTETDKKLRGTT